MTSYNVCVFNSFSKFSESEEIRGGRHHLKNGRMEVVASSNNTEHRDYSYSGFSPPMFLDEILHTVDNG